MPERHEWLRLGAVGVAALIGVPGDFVSLGLDRLYSLLDEAAGKGGRELSTQIAQALEAFARHQDPGTLESARLKSETLLARFAVSDAGLAALDLKPERAADAVLEKARFSSDERIEVLPLCRRLLICFYRSVVETPDLFPELLPHVHQEHLSRLRRIESKQDRTQETLETIRGDHADITTGIAELKDAISGEDRKFTEKLINAQLDLARQLIEAHRPHAAIELL